MQPPKGWKAPTRLDDTFRCYQLNCDLRAGACSRRFFKRVNGTSEPYFPYCHEGCAQGADVVKATGYVHHGNRQKGGMSEEEFSDYRKRRSSRKRHRVTRTEMGRPCVICGGEGCDFCLE